LISFRVYYCWNHDSTSPSRATITASKFSSSLFPLNKKFFLYSPQSIPSKMEMSSFLDLSPFPNSVCSFHLDSTPHLSPMVSCTYTFFRYCRHQPLQRLMQIIHAWILLQIIASSHSRNWLQLIATFSKACTQDSFHLLPIKRPTTTQTQLLDSKDWYQMEFTEKNTHVILGTWHLHSTSKTFLGHFFTHLASIYPDYNQTKSATSSSC